MVVGYKGDILKRQGMKLILFLLYIMSITSCVYVEKCTEKHFYKEVENVDESIKNEQEKE